MRPDGDRCRSWIVGVSRMHDAIVRFVAVDDMGGGAAVVEVLV